MLDGVGLPGVWRIPRFLRVDVVFQSLFEYMLGGRIEDRLNLEKGVPKRSAAALLGTVVDPSASFRPHGNPMKAIKCCEHGEPD